MKRHHALQCWMVGSFSVQLFCLLFYSLTNRSHRETECIHAYKQSVEASRSVYFGVDVVQIADAGDAGGALNGEKISEMHVSNKERVARAILEHQTHAEYIEAMQHFHSNGSEGLRGTAKYFLIDCTSTECHIQATEQLRVFQLKGDKFECLPSQSTITFVEGRNSFNVLVVVRVWMCRQILLDKMHELALFLHQNQKNVHGNTYLASGMTNHWKDVQANRDECAFLDDWVQNVLVEYAAQNGEELVFLKAFKVSKRKLNV